MIILNNDYFIDVDDFNYTLKRDTHKKYADKNGKEINVTEVISYFSSLENALIGAKNYFINQSLQDDIYSLKEAVNIVINVNLEFERMIKGKKGNK